MALDATAREANVRDSIKKYFIDNIYTTEGIAVMFDTSVSEPDLRKITMDRWLSVAFGSMGRETLSFIITDLYCCTRRDPEGFRLAQLCDTVMGYLTDIDSSDGMKKITFYQSRASGAWTDLGGLVIQDIIESPENLAPDETKFKMLNVRWRFASKV